MSEWAARLGAAALALACAAATAAGAAPAAPSGGATQTYFGTVVADPYRRLENLDDPAVAAWMKSQARRAAATLASIPGRDGLLDTFRRYDAAVPAHVGGITRVAADEFFLLRRGARDNQFKLVHRRAGRERVLVDPDALARRAGGTPYAINWYSASPDGRHVAYGVSRQGSEDAVLHVLDTATGREVGAAVDRAEYGGVSWAPDGRSFVFTRLQKMGPRSAPTGRYLNSQVRLMRLGTSATRAPAVFGNAVPGLPIEPVASPFVELSADGRWALGVSIKGTQNDIDGVYVASQAGLLAGSPAWVRVLDASARVTAVALHDDTLVLLSHRASPRFEVLAVDLKAPDLSQAAVLVSASDRVVTGIAAASDALYVEARDGNVKRLFKRAWRDAAGVEEVALPLAGSFSLGGDDEGGPGAANPRLPGLLLELESWTQARQVYAVEPDGRVRNTGLQPAGPDDAPGDIEATEVLASGADGAAIPMSILHRKGLERDGRRPTLLYGYGSYGMTEEPFFSSSRRAWIDAGGVYAIANPRGSGVYGDDWYKGGFQASKPNTWRDFIACAEYLVAQRYTTPSRLGILGGSAGGILVGRAMTERPDLFAAVVASGGALDMIRAEDEPNGAPNVPEFGTRTTEAGFRSLLAMSTYHHVEPGVAYPAVMLMAGVNDPRVAVWQSSKTAARLMDASTSGRPVLLRLDYASGHGIGDTKQQELLERADTYAFLLWQLGVEGFQPRGAHRTTGHDRAARGRPRP